MKDVKRDADLKMLTQSLIAAVFLLAGAHATPTGNHTCTGVVKHEVTVRVNVTEPVTFRAYEWCLRVPPRCSTYTIQLKDRVKIYKEMHNRTITVCCKGYVEIDYKCVPACPPETECPNMHCNRTNHCYCTPGYTGLYCNHPCPKGVWGAGCIKPCDCPPGYTCHHLTGDCMIDDSPPSKTRRTTTAEYLTEAAMTLDTTHPTTRTPTTIQTTQPTTTTTTTKRPTSTTTTTTERPTTTTTTTTTTTERVTTTEVVTQTPTTIQPTTDQTTTTPTTTTTLQTTEQTTTPPTTTTTLRTTEQTTTTPTTTTTEQTTTTPTTTKTEQATTLSTSTQVPTIQKTFEATTTQPPTTRQDIDTTKKMASPPIHVETAVTAEGTTPTSTSTTTNTPKKTIEISNPTTTTLLPPPLTMISTVTAPSITPEEKTTEATTPITTTTVMTQAPTAEYTTTTERTTKPTALDTTPTTLTTQTTVQTTVMTTHIPTTTTTESLPTTPHEEIQTGPTLTVSPPIKFDSAAITHPLQLVTEGNTETTNLPTTVPQTSTYTEPTTPSTTTVDITTTTERQRQAPITSTTTTVAPKTAPPTEEALQTSTTVAPQPQKENLDVWDTKPSGSATKPDGKKSLQSIVKIDLAEQQIIPTSNSEKEHERRDGQQILEKQWVDDNEKILENMGALTSTTDRLDRLIIEDVPKPAPAKPTPDDSPIKLVKEVISKYFPDTFLKPSRPQTNDKDEGPGKPKVTEKPITSWTAETKEKTHIRTEPTEALGTEEQTKSHPRTDITTTTIPPPTTPDISTIPIITPKVIVSAKNPDEIDLGGVIYRKMKFFPLAKQPEESHAQATPLPTTMSIPRVSPTVKEPTTPIGDRFKIYLPEYEKNTGEVDSENTESPTVKTLLPKLNFDKEDLDYGKQAQPKKAKQKDKEVKKYKMKPNEATVPSILAEDVENERVTNNVFLETREFKVHLATTNAAKFGDGHYTKPDQEGTDFAKIQKKKPKYASPQYDPTKFVKYTVPPGSQDSEEGTREGNFPTTNAKPPHTWYSHAREKAKIKNAFKIMKSTIGLDLNANPTEESALEESNDIHSMATQFTEREPRSAAVTYQEDLSNPQMFGQVKFNAPEGFLSSMADDGVKSGIYASVAVGGGCFVAMATLLAVLWLRLKGRSRPRESSVSFEDGDIRNPVIMGQQGRPSNTIGDYETVYPIANESDVMEVATFFCPTFTNNYAERINREFRELSYDHPRSSIAEPLYAEIVHPKIKDVADELEQQ